MRKLEASMRDRAAKRWSETRHYYKVGSYFKGCAHCGDVEEVGTDSGGVVLRYLTGHQVYRSYSPKQIGWTYWCYECGAKDHQCWEGAIDVGKDAVVGNRDAVRSIKAAMRKDSVRNEQVVRAPTRKDQVAELEAELARLMEMLRRKQ